LTLFLIHTRQYQLEEVREKDMLTMEMSSKTKWTPCPREEKMSLLCTMSNENKLIGFLNDALREKTNSEADFQEMFAQIGNNWKLLELFTMDKKFTSKMWQNVLLQHILCKRAESTNGPCLYFRRGKIRSQVDDRLTCDMV